MPPVYDYPDEDLPVPSDGMDFYEPVHSAPSTHVTLTSGVEPGQQSTAGLEGLSDLLEGLAKGTVTVINAVNKPPEIKPTPATPTQPTSTQPAAPPATPPKPPAAAPPVTVLVNPQPAAPKSHAAVVAVGVVAAVAALGVGIALVSRPPRRSRPVFLAGRDEPLEVELVPAERPPLPWERQLTAGERP